MHKCIEQQREAVSLSTYEWVTSVHLQLHLLGMMIFLDCCSIASGGVSVSGLWLSSQISGAVLLNLCIVIVVPCC